MTLFSQVPLHQPFAAFRAPRSTEIEVYAPAKTRLWGDSIPSRAFFAGKFAQPIHEWVVFEPAQAQEATAAQTTSDAEEPDTSQEEYIHSLECLIPRLQQRKGKTVISTICSLPSSAAPAELASKLFENSPVDFCSFFFHPDLGMWMGASPELLFQCDLRTGDFRTMALAGTLPAGLEWDAKNREENATVARYIVSVLQQCGVTGFTASNAAEASFGDLKHLKVEVKGNLGAVSPLEVIDALNPTPALCGFPREDALSDIQAYEKHQRGCYGGCVGFVQNHTLNAYVNIRCCRLHSDSITIYAGGGIMPDSAPLTEWEEAVAKRTSIKKRLGLR